MIGHKKAIFDIILAIMAYLIFAVSLILVNIVKYRGILLGFYIVLFISYALMLLSLKNYDKDLKIIG